ncbi:21782_t:CDS:2, partial [Gigaspora margarita]
MDPLQKVVNNERTLENRKKIKMKHEAMQIIAESGQLGSTPLLEKMTTSFLGIKTNLFSVLKDFLTETEEWSQVADPNIQIETSQGEEPSIPTEIGMTSIQQMQIDDQYVTNVNTQETAKMKIENGLVRETMQVREEVRTYGLKEKPSYSAILT